VVLIPFSKYQGSGNDFIIIDDRAALFACENSLLIRRLCNRRLGIGGDGLLLLQASNKTGFRIRIFNSDGHEVAMCGNGMRCFVHYLRSLGFRDNPYSIEAMHDIIVCYVKADKISVQIDRPHVLHWGVPLDVHGHSFEAFVVHTGVPHAVIFVEDLEDLDIETLGPAIRHDPLFAPEGVNVNFVNTGADGALRIRTYERGVEGETHACGTGAAAAALTAVQKIGISTPVRVVPLSGDYLEVDIRPLTSGGQQIEVSGGAVCIFSGHLSLEQFLS
jgi:diaminopimelate epimerase